MVGGKAWSDQLIQNLYCTSLILLLVFANKGWSSIVDGHSVVRIHAINADEATGIVLAHWETDYNVKNGSVWYGTDVDISDKQVRGFQVFASFTTVDGKITKVVQRSDTVIKHLGVEKEVLAFRNKQTN